MPCKGLAEESASELAEILQQNYLEIIKYQKSTIHRLITQLSVVVGGNLILSELSSTTSGVQEIITSCSVAIVSILVSVRPERIFCPTFTKSQPKSKPRKATTPPSWTSSSKRARKGKVIAK